MKKYLIKKSNAPGNNTITKEIANEKIKEYNKNLFDTSQWIRFQMMDGDQGITGRYAFYINDKQIHYYYIEQHSFQTPGKQTKNTKYINLFLHCEVDENNNIIGPVELKPASDEYPLIVMKALHEEFAINSEITVTIGTNDLQQTITYSKELEG